MLGNEGEVMDAVSERHSPPSKFRAIRRRAVEDRMFIVDWLFFITIILAIAPLIIGRTKSAQVLIAVAVLCGVYVGYGVRYFGVWLRSRLLLGWSVLGVLYLFLSWTRWLPGTRYVFLQDYILRMGYFTCLVYPATAAFYLLFTRARKAGKLRVLGLFCILSAVGSALSYHFFPVYDGFWRVEGEQSGFISDIMDSLNYAISNVLVLFGWGVLLFALGRPHLMIVAIAVLLVSASEQMHLFALIVLSLWLWPRPSKIVVPLAVSIFRVQSAILARGMRKKHVSAARPDFARHVIAPWP